MKMASAYWDLDFLQVLLARTMASWLMDDALDCIIWIVFISSRSFRQLIHTYFGLKLPNIKVAITGSGRVAHGLLEIMNLLGIIEMEPDEYLERDFAYPVFTQLKGADLYAHKLTGKYNREDFHLHPQDYVCLFPDYIKATDILMNGIYWDRQMPRLFEWEHMAAAGLQH